MEARRQRSADRKVVDRLLTGSEEAFEAFFSDYFPRLFRFALVRMDHHSDAAEEVAQATLCAAIPKLHTFRGEAALFSWLCTFCRHEIGGWLRKNRRHAARVELLEEIPEVRAALDWLSATSGREGPEEELRRRELAGLVRATLDQLPTHYGDALEWKYIKGWSVKEIAAKLELSPKAAESLLTRAREAFRGGFSEVARDLAGQGAHPAFG